MRWMLACGCADWDWMTLTLDYQLFFPTSMYEQYYIDSFDPLQPYKAWLEFLGLVTSWLGKVLLSVSLGELVNWLIWPSSLCIVCMRESWFFMYFLYFSQNQSFTIQVEDFGRKMVELGWENFIDNLKNCWQNCVGNLKSWVDDWKNYWDDGSGLHGSTVGGHFVLAPWEIWMISPARIVRWSVRIIVRSWEGRIHRFRKMFVSLKYRTLLKHMIHGLTISTTRSWNLVWADLIDWTWFLSF